MKKNKQDWILKIGIFIILTLITIQTTNALIIETPELITTPEEKIEFKINIKNNLSNVTIKTEPDIGKITNQTPFTFTWDVNYEDKTYKDIIFIAEDNTTKTNSTTRFAKPPKITGLYNDSIEKETYEFTLNTDIEATCKYGLEKKEHNDLEYTMQTQDNKAHKGTTPKLKQDTHTIHINCKTNKGGESKDYFTLDVNLPPTARISLKPPTPLRAGIIEIEVITSQDLRTAPELRYFFDDDTSPRTITLTGRDNRWTGHMIIEETTKRRIGTFTFKGRDKTNMEGDEITSGKTFIVDNNKPKTISSFTGTMEEDRIKLEWRYLDEELDDIKEYRIYRRERTGGVDYTDYYQTTRNTYFYDRDVSHSEAYYYKVTAVNQAGRESELSKEIALTFIPETREVEESEEELKPILKTQLNIIKNQIDNKILNLETTQSNLQNKTDEKAEIIQDLNLLPKIITAKNKLENIKEELTDFEKKSLTETEFEQITNPLIEDAEKIAEEALQEIIIEDVIIYDEELKEDIAEKTIKKYLETQNINLSHRDAQRYIENAIQEQTQFTTEVKIIKAKIKYANREEPITHITKKIKSDENQQNIVLLDNIKLDEFEEIKFVESVTKIKDEIIARRLDNADGNKIRYYATENISADNIRQTQTIILKEEKLEETRNQITAMATKERGDIEHTLLIPLIIAILSVLILSVYYFKDDETTIIELLSLRNIIPKKIFKQNQQQSRNQKIELEQPPSLEETKNLELTENETKTLTKYTTKEADANKIQETQKEEQITKTQEQPEEPEEPEDVYNVLHDLKDMMEEIYYEDDFDDFEYLKKLKQIRKKYNKKAPAGKEFILKTGERIDTINELRQALKTMSKETFNHHVNQEKNDFYKWINDVYKYRGLARRIKRAKTKKEIIKKLKP